MHSAHNSKLVLSLKASLDSECETESDLAVVCVAIDCKSTFATYGIAYEIVIVFPWGKGPQIIFHQQYFFLLVLQRIWCKTREGTEPPKKAASLNSTVCFI